MRLSKRVASLERHVFGDGKVYCYAIANTDGTFSCSGANVTTRAEYKAYIEEKKKQGGYDIFYVLNYAGDDSSGSQ